MVPYNALVRHAKRELDAGRDSIDVIEDLQMKGLTPKEAEELVGKLLEESSDG